MKFSCEKALLSQAVSVTGRAVAAKSTIPALEGILVEAGSVLRLTGYDLITGIQSTVPADIQQPGSLVLSARLFSEIVRKLPDDVVHFSSEGYMVNIRCGMSEYNILATDAEEFPELPSVDTKCSISLNQATLRAMIAQTLFAVSCDKSRPTLNGSLFDIRGEQLRIVSVDGYRLALRQEKLEQKNGPENFSFIVPTAALGEVEKICSGDETVEILQGARHILFRTGDVLLVCRQIDGAFLSYEKAIPKNNPIQVECDRQAMLSCLDRVSLIISEKLKSPLRCRVGREMFYVTTKTALGDAADQCPIVGDGEDLTIGFNHKYLMDCLKAAPADRLRLEFSSGLAPCVVLPAQEEQNFIYMVLSVRIRNE